MNLNKERIGLSRAAGEALVAYKLARNGWLPVNANGAVANMPNFDLLALKGRKRVTIQIRAAVGGGWAMFAGVAKADGKYFNTKPGPKADYVVVVRLNAKDDGADCYVMRAATAQRLARDHARRHGMKPKMDGTKRSPRFPIWIKEQKLKRWHEAWGLLV